MSSSDWREAKVGEATSCGSGGGADDVEGGNDDVEEEEGT